MTGATVEFRDGVYRIAGAPAAERVFTAYCDEGEEIDVEAFTLDHARLVALAAIALDYEPIAILRIEERIPGAVTF